MSPIRIGGIIDSRAPTYGMKSIRNVIDAHRNTNGISMNERTILPPQQLVRRQPRL